MNMFLDKSNHIKIGDLGVAKVRRFFLHPCVVAHGHPTDAFQVLGSMQFAQTMVGTPYYLS